MIKTFKSEAAALAWANQKVGVCFGSFRDAKTSLALIGITIEVTR